MNTHSTVGLAMSAVATSVLTGCVVSAAPVISEFEATFDTRLVGTWRGEDWDEEAVISRAEGRVYAIEYRGDDGERIRYQALLGKLGSRMVLDVWPTPRSGDIADAYEGLMIPGHVVLVVEITEDRVTTSPLDPDALSEALASREVALAATETDEQLLLHGRTEELASALAAFLDREDAIADPGGWRRAPDRTGRARVRR